MYEALIISKSYLSLGSLVIAIHISAKETTSRSSYGPSQRTMFPPAFPPGVNSVQLNPLGLERSPKIRVQFQGLVTRRSVQRPVRLVQINSDPIPNLRPAESTSQLAENICDLRLAHAELFGTIP